MRDDCSSFAGIVYHHCLNFLFRKKEEKMCLFVFINIVTSVDNQFLKFLFRKEKNNNRNSENKNLLKIGGLEACGI